MLGIRCSARLELRRLLRCLEAVRALFREVLGRLPAFLLSPFESPRRALGPLAIARGRPRSRLVEQPPREPDRGTEPLNDRFGIAPLTSDGRTRCQVTLWKKSALQTILRVGETAWDFEAHGSVRTQEMEILTYLRRENSPVPYLMSAISRGLWMPAAVALCREHAVAIEPFFRPVFSDVSWQRRLKHALGRGRLQRALRAQMDKPVEL